MPTMIPPTRVVRRLSAKRRQHIVDTRQTERDADTTMCGQHIRGQRVRSTVRTAEQITCDDCLVAAISKGRPN